MRFIGTKYPDPLLSWDLGRTSPVHNVGTLFDI